MSKLREGIASWVAIILGLMAMLFMVSVVFPALLVWALIERTRIDAEAEFDETGAPTLPEIEKARQQHMQREGWRW